MQFFENRFKKLWLEYLLPVYMLPFPDLKADYCYPHDCVLEMYEYARLRLKIKIVTRQNV